VAIEMNTKFNGDRSRYKSNIKVSTPTISDAAVLVLLIRAIYGV
jgi:hypothetical protein